jgi:hypothetical protein
MVSCGEEGTLPFFLRRLSAGSEASERRARTAKKKEDWPLTRELEHKKKKPLAPLSLSRPQPSARGRTPWRLHPPPTRRWDLSM